MWLFIITIHLGDLLVVPIEFLSLSSGYNIPSLKPLIDFNHNLAKWIIITLAMSFASNIRLILQYITYLVSVYSLYFFVIFETDAYALGV